MTAGLSPAYKKFADPIDNSGGPGGFDAHIYFDQVGVTVVMVVVMVMVMWLTWRC